MLIFKLNLDPRKEKFNTKKFCIKGQNKSKIYHESQN